MLSGLMNAHSSPAPRTIFQSHQSPPDWEIPSLRQRPNLDLGKILVAMKTISY